MVLEEQLMSISNVITTNTWVEVVIQSVKVTPKLVQYTKLQGSYKCVIFFLKSRFSTYQATVYLL